MYNNFTLSLLVVIKIWAIVNVNSFTLRKCHFRHGVHQKDIVNGIYDGIYGEISRNRPSEAFSCKLHIQSNAISGDSGENCKEEEYISAYDDNIVKQLKEKCVAVLLCGGVSSRLKESIGEANDINLPEGLPRSKQFVHIHGIPVFLYSFAELLNSPLVDEIVVVSQPSWHKYIIGQIHKHTDFLNYIRNSGYTNGNKVSCRDQACRCARIYKSKVENGEAIDYNIYSDIDTLIYDVDRGFFMTPNDDSTVSLRQKLVKFCESGSERYFSVYNGLRHIKSSTDNLKYDNIILIHDGARPLLRLINLKELIETAKEHNSAIPGYQNVDTLKRILYRDNSMVVDSTINRSNLYNIQTPQAFKFGVIMDSYTRIFRAANKNGTESQDSCMLTLSDDASFVEECKGSDIHIVKGNKFNVKLTTVDDIEICKMLLWRLYFS